MLAQRSALLFVPIAMVLSACPPKHVDFGRDGEPKSAEDLLKRIEFVEAQVTSIKGDAKLFVDSPQGKGSVTLFVGVAQPSLVHIEQLDFFGRPQGVFVTDGERFGLYQAAENTYFRGPATAPNLGKFLPVVMPPSELASVMLGRAPRIAHESLSMRFADGLFVLTLKKGSVTQTLHVQPPSYRAVKSAVEGIDAYELAFSDIEDNFPKTVFLKAAKAKTSVELSLKSVTVNEEPDLTMFDLQAPEDIPVVEVDGTGFPGQPPSK
ncbi:MAG: DUF4292 domain-containing protein [Archangium sp.]